MHPVDYQKVIASNFKAKTWNTIRVLDAVKQILNNNDGIVISIPVYKDFDTLNNNNPTYDKISRDSRGRNAICIIGYDDTLRVLTNSAFKTYNDRGFKSVAHTFDNRYCVEISEFVDANCGNPPVLKIDSTYGYMSAQTSESRIIKYKITYNSNGGSGTMSGSTVLYNATEKLKKNTFTKTGYTFDGWYVRRSGNEWLYKNNSDNTTGWYREGNEPTGFLKYKFKDQEAFSNLTTVNHDKIYLYAQWKPID